MKQSTLLLCESIIIEKDTNKLSLIGLFDKITANKLPIPYPKFAILSRIEEGKGQHDHKITIKHSESNAVVAQLPGKINFGDSGRSQYIGNFIGVQFNEFGKYIIEIYINDKLQPLTTYIEIVKE